MHIDTYYKQFWADALSHFENGKFEYDQLIDDPGDKRFGLTVLVRPSNEVRTAIDSMLNELGAIEPGQYFYPPADMHVTVLSLVSCYNGFNTKKYVANDYLRVIKQALDDIGAFKIHFQGVTASPSCVMVQGYPDGELNLIRNNLRDAFAQTSLEQSFDTRYTIMAAHSTVMRFKQNIRNKDQFIAALKKFRNHEFGTTHVQQVEFVYNDWYQRRQKGIVHAVFNLKG